MQHEKPDDWVVATGETYTVENFLIEGFNIVGLNWKDYEFHPKIFQTK